VRHVEYMLTHTPSRRMSHATEAHSIGYDAVCQNDWPLRA
jgi:hypothetical protein